MKFKTKSNTKNYLKMKKFLCFYVLSRKIVKSDFHIISDHIFVSIPINRLVCFIDLFKISFRLTYLPGVKKYGKNINSINFEQAGGGGS